MLELDDTIWLRAGEDSWGGCGRTELLVVIRQTGSITTDAKVVGLLYKAVWGAVDTMNNLAGGPLVVRTTGDKDDSSDVLTPHTQRLIESSRVLEVEYRHFVEHLDTATQTASEGVNLLYRLTSRTSACNALFGMVESAASGAVSDVVMLHLPSGQTAAATITQESTRVLGLAPGVQIVAFIKTPAVMLMHGAGEWRVSAENQLPCVVTEIRGSTAQTEVRLRLLDVNVASMRETMLVTMLPRTAVRALILTADVEAVTVFETSSVISGLA